MIEQVEKFTEKKMIEWEKGKMYEIKNYNGFRILVEHNYLGTSVSISKRHFD